MRRFALGALLTAAVVAAVTAASAPASRAASIGPHVYSTKIAGAKPAVLNGTWRLTVNRKSFSVARGTTFAVSGTARIVGNRITIHDVDGPFACRGAQATGVYSWRISGKRLTLTAVREPCAGRKTILTRPFTQIL
jgi:predicted ABC-type sugar transport system permease subunit